MLERTRPAPQHVAGRWAYSARTPGRATSDGTERFRAAVRGTLRAAHGADVRFGLEVGTGGAPVALLVEDVLSECWVERTLLPLYGPGAWRSSARTEDAVSTLRWAGTRRGLPGEHGVPPAGLGRLLGALTSALRWSTCCATLRVRLRPAPLPKLRLLEAWAPAPAPLLAAGRPNPSGLRRPAGAASRELPAGAPAPAWLASIDLRIAGRPPIGGAGRLAEAVRSGWSTLDGSPLRLRQVAPDSPSEHRTWLSEEELLSLLPDPNEPASRLDPAAGQGIPIGRASDGSLVALPVEAHQGRHFAIIGETGIGKSSLLVSVALRAARYGSVIVLDPLGETSGALRREFERSRRTVTWVGPGARSSGLDALAGIRASRLCDPVRAERELSALVHGLRRVRAGRYVDSSYWGPRLEEMIVRALRAAAELPGGTLEDAHALLVRAPDRSVVPENARPYVHDLTERVRERPDDAEGARRLLYEVVRNPTLAAMLCARNPSLSLEELVGPSQCVLVAGEAARVGEATARYLLATYLALLWSALLARPVASKLFLLLEEAQWFAHEGLGEMLRLARRCNVHVGVVTQSVASLPEELRDAVRTNVADLVAFRGSADEAREIGRVAPEVAVGSLLGLGRGEAVALLGKGEVVRWVKTARLPETLEPDSRASHTPAGVQRDTPLAPPVGAASAALRPALAMLREDARVLRAGELLEVDVAALRAATELGDRGVRTLGSELGRRHAIVRKVRTATDWRWYLDPHALLATGEDADSTAALGGTRAPQRL